MVRKFWNDFLPKYAVYLYKTQNTSFLLKDNS